MTLAFRVYGVPLAKGNLRPMIRENKRGMKIAIATESNRNVKGWQQLIAEGASRAIGAMPEDERTMIAYGARVSIAFYLPRPQKLNKRGVFVAHCTAPDVDKLARAVLDALTAVAFGDDKQVTELVAAKYYAEVGGPPYVEIRVEAAPVPAVVGPPVLRAALPLFEADEDAERRQPGRPARPAEAMP
jgi:Holliday junction resolvase RusA-like endonuclease